MRSADLLMAHRKLPCQGLLGGPGRDLGTAVETRQRGTRQEVSEEGYRRRHFQLDGAFIAAVRRASEPP